MPVIARYCLVTFVPFILIWVGATLWGPAAVLALLWLTLIAASLDGLLAPPVLENADHAPWSDRLSLALGLGHLLILPVVLMALAGPELGFWHRVALLFATASFFGQVSHPNAHELIHRRPRHLKALGAAVYTSMGFGHHVSAHRLVHHRYVGTDQDPNSPLPDESFWDYLPRAWRGSFEAGLACEEERLARRGTTVWSPQNPYYLWVGGAVLALILAAWLAGPIGVLAHLVLSALFGGQVLLSDYIQHYGLQRLELENGRIEPIASHHSWNAPKGFSSFLMMNAPAHSEHHLHPDRPYDRLDPGADVPMMPYSMPIMATLATIPPVWHRVMDRRAIRVLEAAQKRIAEGQAPTSFDRPELKPVEANSAEDEVEGLIRRLTETAE